MKFYIITYTLNTGARSGFFNNYSTLQRSHLLPWSERSLGGGHGNPLQDSCLENPIHRGAWRGTVHRVTKSQTRLKQLSTQHTPMINKKPLGKLGTQIGLFCLREILSGSPTIFSSCLGCYVVQLKEHWIRYPKAECGFSVRPSTWHVWIQLLHLWLRAFIFTWEASLRSLLWFRSSGQFTFVWF